VESKVIKKIIVTEDFVYGNYEVMLKKITTTEYVFEEEPDADTQ
jgi:hypothetical protein